MDDKLHQILKQQGTALAGGANHPFLLDDPDRVWFVEKGVLEVFVVNLKNHVPAGVRQHCCTVLPGGALFGLNITASGTGMALLAVGGADTMLIKVRRRALEKIGRQKGRTAAVSNLVDQWIFNLSRHIVKGIFPPQAEAAAPQGAMTYASSANLRPAQGVVWVKPIRGRTLYLSLLDVINPTQDSYMPLTTVTWLATLDKVDLIAINTAEIITSGNLGAGLKVFYHLWFESETLNRNLAKVDELNRVREKERLSAHLQKRTLVELASVLEKRTAILPDTTRQQDLLLSACQVVGRAQGIPVQSPPDSYKEIPGRDPLADIVDASRCRCRKVTLTENWWQQDHGPLLGYIGKGNTPVALISDRSRHYHAHNPADQTITRVTSQNAAEFNSEAYNFYRFLPRRPLTGKDLLKYCLKGSERDLAWIVILGVWMGGLAVLIPLLTGWVFDAIVPEAEYHLLLQVGIMLLVASVAGGLLEVTRNFLLLKVEFRIDYTILPAVMDHLLTLPAYFFRNYTSGDLANRLMGVGRIRQMLSGNVLMTIISSLFVAGNLAVLFYFDPGLALIALFLVMLLLILNIAAIHKEINYLHRSVHHEGRVAGTVLQFLTGISKLRAAGAEFQMYASWAYEFARQKRWSFRGRTVGIWLTMLNTNAYLLALVLFFVFIANYTDHGLSVGDFMAFNTAFAIFITAFLKATNAVSSALRIIPLYERVKPILQGIPELSALKTDPGQLTGEIEMNHVFFSYTSDQEPVLKDIHLHVRPGEFVAIVGPSGSGKSTLMRLMLGMNMPDSGAVYYNGQELDHLDISKVRRQIGVVLQNSRLTAGNILYNIIGSLNLTIKDAWKAARLANIDDEIASWPMGMDTLVMAGGSSFSGGQRQRLLIARALASKPRILLFDEATSAIDNRRQACVSLSLEKINATRIVIAHRLSTIKNADRIYVLDKGRIVETGTFSELMAAGCLFSQIAGRQLV